MANKLYYSLEGKEENLIKEERERKRERERVLLKPAFINK